MTDKLAPLTKALSIDAKLTRSEVMDLIIEEAEAALAAEEEALDKEYADVLDDDIPDAVNDALIKRVKFDTPRLERCSEHLSNEEDSTEIHWMKFRVVYDGETYGDGRFVDVKENDPDPVVANYIRRRIEYRVKMDDVCKRRIAFRGSKAQVRNTVLKRVLESTDEGKALLESIKALTVTFTTKK